MDLCFHFIVYYYNSSESVPWQDAYHYSCTGHILYIFPSPPSLPATPLNWGTKNETLRWTRLKWMRKERTEVAGCVGDRREAEQEPEMRRWNWQRIELLGKKLMVGFYIPPCLRSSVTFILDSEVHVQWKNHIVHNQLIGQPHPITKFEICKLKRREMHEEHTDMHAHRQTQTMCFIYYMKHIVFLSLSACARACL